MATSFGTAAAVTAFLIEDAGSLVDGARRCHRPAFWCLIAPMICLPTPDAAIVERRASLVNALRSLVASGNVVEDDLRLAAYEKIGRAHV